MPGYILKIYGREGSALFEQKLLVEELSFDLQKLWTGEPSVFLKKLWRSNFVFGIYGFKSPFSDFQNLLAG